MIMLDLRRLRVVLFGEEYSASFLLDMAVV